MLELSVALLQAVPHT